jgi:hypothetical protein
MVSFTKIDRIPRASGKIIFFNKKMVFAAFFKQPLPAFRKHMSHGKIYCVDLPKKCRERIAL